MSCFIGSFITGLFDCIYDFSSREHSTAGNRKEDVSASVAMVHSIPELIVSEEVGTVIILSLHDKFQQFGLCTQ